MTPEKIIELAQSIGLTLPRRGDYFFINHEDLAKLLKARSEACAKLCDLIYFKNYPDAEDWERSEEGEAILAMDDQ